MPSSGTVTVPASGGPLGRMTSASSAEPIRFTPGFSHPRPASVSQPISFRRRRYRSSRHASTSRRARRRRRSSRRQEDQHRRGPGTDAHVRRPPAVDRVRRRACGRMRSCRRGRPRSVPRRTWPARPPRSPRSDGSARISSPRPRVIRRQRAPRRSSVPASCQLSPSAGARSAAARSASTVARTRPRGGLGPVVDRTREEGVARIIRRGHVEELGRRGAHAPPQDPRLVGRLGVEPLREALGAAFAQDAVESARIAHRDPDVADFGHSDAV